MWKKQSHGKYSPKEEIQKSYQFIKWCFMIHKECEGRYLTEVAWGSLQTQQYPV